MTKIFIGLLFLFVNFDINVENIYINLAPDIVGYILMILGVSQFTDMSRFFKTARIWTIVATIVICIGIITDFVPMQQKGLLVLIPMICEILSMLLQIFIIFCIIKGIGDLEYSENDNYNADKLMDLWIVESIIEIITAVCLVAVTISMVVENEILNDLTRGAEFIIVPAGIAALVFSILFLVKFNNTRKRIDYDR